MLEYKAGKLTGSELKKARTALNLSRRILACMTGLHPDTIRYWEQKLSVDTRGYAPGLIISALGLHMPEPPLIRRLRPNSMLVNFATPKVRARRGEIERCGAKTRKSTLCQCKPLPNKRRCKYHGGASTGSKTPEGRQRQSEAQHRRWTRWRESQATNN